MEWKRRWWLIPLMLTLIWVTVSLTFRFGKAMWVRMLLDRAWAQEQAVCEIHMEMPVSYHDASVSWDTVLEKRYVTVNSGPDSIYLHDGALYFSSGNGYRLDGLMENLPFTAEQLRMAQLFIPWEAYRDSGYRAWRLALPEEPGILLRTLLPDVEQYWDQLRTLNLCLYEESGNLRYVLLEGDDLSVYLELKAQQPELVPTELLMQMGTASLPDIRTLEPLFRACMDLYETETVQGDLHIHVECGPLPVQETARVLLSPDGLFLGRGEQWTAMLPDSVGRQEFLLGIGWTLLKEGVWEPSEPDGGTMSLTLNAGDIRTSLFSIIPELEGLDLALDDGELTVRIEGNQFSGMDLTDTGQIPFLFTEIPLSVHLELTLDE